MAEVTVNEGSLPVIKISSDEAPATKCDTCHAGDLTYHEFGVVPLSDVCMAAGSGCQNCELRLYGVRSITRAFQRPTSDDLVMVVFYYGVIKIHVTDKQSLSQSGLSSWHYIKLFTPLDQPASSLPCVEVGRDVVRTIHILPSVIVGGKGL